MYTLFVVDISFLVEKNLDLLGHQPTGIKPLDRYCLKKDGEKWYYQKLDHLTGDINGKWKLIESPIEAPCESLNRYRFYNGLPVGEEWLYVKEDIRRVQKAYKSIS